MAENCQYCGGRLKKLHPSHEVLCSERPRSLLINGPAGPEVVKMLVKDIEALAVTNQKTVTKIVTTPGLVTPESDDDWELAKETATARLLSKPGVVTDTVSPDRLRKMTRAEKARLKRAANGGY